MRRAVPRDAAPRPERLRERVPESREDVLDGVVLVDVQIAGREQLEVEAAVRDADRWARERALDDVRRS